MRAMKRRRAWEGVASSVVAASVVLLSMSWCSPNSCSVWAAIAGTPRGMLSSVRNVPKGITDWAVVAAGSSRQDDMVKGKKRTRHRRIADGTRGDEEISKPCATTDATQPLEDTRAASSDTEVTATSITPGAAHESATFGAKRPTPPLLPPWRKILRARTKTLFSSKTAAQPDSDASSLTAAAAAAAVTAGYPEMTAKTLQRTRGGVEKHLNFQEAVLAGAVSRSIAHTCVHPAILVKTLLQGRGTATQLSKMSLKLLTRGSGAQFVMSLPHGAFNYATLELIMGFSAKIFPSEWRERAGPVIDFITSGVATLFCSVISTPQIVIEDRIMTGMYLNLADGVRQISRSEGWRGFYTGWSANVSQKIPSYGLTWVFYQSSKRLYKRVTGRAPTATESFALGAAAAGGAVSVMIPLDTVLTRVITQRVQPGVVPYKGVVPTFFRIINEEGWRSMYSALPIKLMSVVPAIGIQFGIYDYFRKQLLTRKNNEDEEEISEYGGPLLIPPSVGRRLRYSTGTDDALARRLYLLEEELL